MEIRFDDRRTGASYEFRGLREVVEAHSVDQVIPAFEFIQTAVAGGKWAAGFVSYEAAQAFDDVLTVRLGDTGPSLPLLFFALYDDRVKPGPVRTGRYELAYRERDTCLRSGRRGSPRSTGPSCGRGRPPSRGRAAARASSRSSPDREA